MTVSIVHRPGLPYPGPEGMYSPGERYPEYPFGRLSKEPNPVYAAVRDCLAQAGLDAGRLGTPGWNPLGSAIPEGANVFVLCNFVQHRRENESPESFRAKCTHGSVVRAILDYVLIATGPRGTVGFGNAPIQSCDWERVIRDTGADVVESFYRGEPGRDVRAFDLRLPPVEGRRGAVPEAEADLGADSLLDPLYGGGRNPRFGLNDYDSEVTGAHHGPGSHRYRIHRRVLEADVLFSVPKLKTHEKVLLTVGVKGCVGAVSSKACLAHHRVGAPGGGGDEYPDGSLLGAIESRLGRQVDRHPLLAHAPGVRLALRGLRRLIRATGGISAGGWSRNDTAWRMALDIARILACASPEGALGETARRPHLMLVDGIVSGEGQGPLAPSPREDGLLLFADSLPEGDLAACRVMGFEPGRAPTVSGAASVRRYPPAPPVGAPGRIILDGGAVGEAALASVIRPFRPPAGWRGGRRSATGAEG